MVKSVSLYKYRHVMRTFWSKRFSYKRVMHNQDLKINGLKRSKRENQRDRKLEL